MVGLLLKIIAPLVLSGAIGYATWLGTVGTNHERKTRIREALKGEQFESGEITFRVVRVSFLEDNSFSYAIRKRVPLLRELRGQTIITLDSGKSEVSLRADGFGITEYFNTAISINDFLGEEYPEVEYDDLEREKTKLRINSLEVCQVQQILEKAPSYLRERLDNHPGNSEYNFQQ